MGEQTVNIHRFRHRSDTSAAALLRVAAVQLPRLEPEDRAALLKYVERDLTKEASNG